MRGGYGGDSVCCRVIGGGFVGGVGGCAGRGGGVDCGEAISGGGVSISSVTCGSCEGLKVLLRFLPCEGGYRGGCGRVVGGSGGGAVGLGDGKCSSC